MIARAAAAFRPAAPDVRVQYWHISPGIDTFAYAFSWLWLLIPFFFFGPKHPEDYLWYWIVGNTFSYSHRHLTLPYVYLDRQVFGTQIGRFLVVPSLLFAGFLVSGLYRGWTVPAGFFTRTDGLIVLAAAALFWQWRQADTQGVELGRGRIAALVILPLAVLGGLLSWPAGPDHANHALAIGALVLAASLYLSSADERANTFVRNGGPILIAGLLGFAAWSSTQPGVGLAPASRIRMPLIVGGIAAFAGAWNVWHVYMQKYGILRMYAAKSGVEEADRVPGWVDRFLVFGWLPAYLMFLPTAARPLLKQHAPTVLPWLEPLLGRLETVATVGLPLTLALGVASVAIYLRYEWRASRLQNPARLVMGAGTVLLALTFFVFDPFEAYVAYGFSHAVEYVVFVWAFKRRRYREELAHRPLLGRLLAWPTAYYALFFLLIGGSYGFLEYGQGRLYDEPIRFFGTKARSWVFYWTIWQSMAHFYFDSFLWKMRLPEVRASL